jgi:hypothetical protein
MIMACTRLSVDILVNPLLMASMAPLSRMVNRSRRAPKMIKRILKAITTPLRVDAITQLTGIFHRNRARSRVMIKATGMALVAGQRNPTIRIKMEIMGAEASRARIPIDIP